MKTLRSRPVEPTWSQQEITAAAELAAIWSYLLADLPLDSAPDKPNDAPGKSDSASDKPDNPNH